MSLIMSQPPWKTQKREEQPAGGAHQEDIDAGAAAHHEDPGVDALHLQHRRLQQRQLRRGHPCAAQLWDLTPCSNHPTLTSPKQQLPGLYAFRTCSNVAIGATATAASLACLIEQGHRAQPPLEGDSDLHHHMACKLIDAQQGLPHDSPQTLHHQKLAPFLKVWSTSRKRSSGTAAKQ